MNKEFTEGITQRFLQLCSEVIREGVVNNRKDFATSVGEHQQNLSLMDKGTRAPTLEQIVNACKKYGYSANWLMLNQGAKKIKTEIKKTRFTPATMEERVHSLETEVARLDRNLKRIKLNGSGS
jgi:hypothetical protein